MSLCVRVFSVHVCGGGHADKPVIFLFWTENKKWKLVLWQQRKQEKGVESPAKW